MRNILLYYTYYRIIYIRSYFGNLDKSYLIDNLPVSNKFLLKENYDDS